MKKRYEEHNLDGTGSRRYAVYDLPATAPYMQLWGGEWLTEREYWPSVTNVPCPATSCKGFLRWAENGYVPGYRICDSCSRHFLAQGSADSPSVVYTGRRGGGLAAQIKRGVKALREHLASYGGDLLAIEDRMMVSMVDPNDNARSRYQYRIGDHGLERRVATEDGSPWTAYTDGEMAALRAQRGNWHPILDPLGL
jgi:hypothetical protein